MNVTYYHFANDAFLSVNRQVHAIVDGQLYRIFGEGATRYVRKVVEATKQPKVNSKRKVAAILAAVDAFVAVHNLATSEADRAAGKAVNFNA